MPIYGSESELKPDGQSSTGSSKRILTAVFSINIKLFVILSPPVHFALWAHMRCFLSVRCCRGIWAGTDVTGDQ